MTSARKFFVGEPAGANDPFEMSFCRLYSSYPNASEMWTDRRDELPSNALLSKIVDYTTPIEFYLFLEPLEFVSGTCKIGAIVTPHLA